MSQKTFTYFWKRIKKKLAAKGADAPDINPHMFRHTFGSQLLRSGSDIKVVQKLLGHATAAFTLKVYLHYCKEDESQINARLKNYVARTVSAI